VQGSTASAVKIIKIEGEKTLRTDTLA
jgi:hypothetical protein